MLDTNTERTASRIENNTPIDTHIPVTVRWFNGRLMKYRAEAVLLGGDMLKMQVKKTAGDGNSSELEHFVPLRKVRWYSLGKESHQSAAATAEDMEIMRCDTLVTVEWMDTYVEKFAATEVRYGCDLLWMRLKNGQNRHIPLREVAEFSCEDIPPQISCNTDKSEG